MSSDPISHVAGWLRDQPKQRSVTDQEIREDVSVCLARFIGIDRPGVLMLRTPANWTDDDQDDSLAIITEVMRELNIQARLMTIPADGPDLVFLSDELLERMGLQRIR